MQTTYFGEHSITFSGKDAWTEWGLVPVSRPCVAMPPVRESTIEIPGMNGLLDLTDIPLGYPTYGPRMGSWEFYIAHDATNKTWDQTYAELAAYLHGKRRNCILSDDRSYYYEGRFSVGELTSEDMCSKISIDYKLDPFKLMRWTTCGDWLWNPFDFIYGEINQSDFKNIPVSGNKTITWNQNQIGNCPVTPKFIVVSNGTMTVHVVNSVNPSAAKTVTLNAGTTTDPTIEFSCPNSNNTTTITITGTGTISIDFRPGRL